MIRKPSIASAESVFDAGILLAIGLLIFHFIPVSLLLNTRQPVGGDHTAHFYYAWYLRWKLLPHFQWTGWSNDLLAGYPILQYYFPLTFYLSALLGTLISLNVAFKVVFILCIASIPLSTFILLRLLRVPFPGPALGACLATAIMFTEKNFHEGFYILDNLSGQTASTLAMGIFLVYLGVLYRRLDDHQAAWSAGLWIGCASLAHAMLIPAFALCASAYLVLDGPDRRWRSFQVLFVLLLGFGLLAFWAFPFLFDTDFSATGDLTKTITWSFYRQFIDGLVLLIESLAVMGLARALWAKDRAGRLLAFGWGVSLLLLILSLFSNRIGALPVLDRYLPVHWLFGASLAAYGVAFFLRRVLKPLPLELTAWALAGGLIFRIIVTTPTVPMWAQWNFSGLEAKRDYPAFKTMVDFIRDLPGKDRVSLSLMKDSPLTQRMTGPFIWETATMFFNKPGLETGTQGFYSLSFEAVNAFLYQGLLTRNATRLDALSEVFNVRYFVKSSKFLFKDLEGPFRRLAEIPIDSQESYQIFERRRPRWHFVAIPDFVPIRYDGPEAKRKLVHDLAETPELAAIPVVYSRRFKGSSARTIQDIPRIPSRAPACQVEETISDEEVWFHTTCPGTPHLVRISYHPGWRSVNHEEIYQVSPNFMLLYPRFPDTRLIYRPTWAGWLGRIITGLSLVAFAILAIAPRLRRRKR